MKRNKTVIASAATRFSNTRNHDLSRIAQGNAALSAEKQALAAEQAAQAQQRDALQTEVATLTKTRDELNKIATQHQAEIKHYPIQTHQKETCIAQHESELADRDVCKHLLNDELTRAEAQIDLIKDLLLREPRAMNPPC